MAIMTLENQQLPELSSLVSYLRRPAGAGSCPYVPVDPAETFVSVRDAAHHGVFV